MQGVTSNSPEQVRRHTAKSPAYYVVGLSMAIPALLFGLFLGASWVAVFAIMQGRVDFRQLYAAASMVRTHHGYELYDYDAQKHFQDTLVSPAQLALPFVRPAYQALLFVPLSFLSFRYAYVLWFALNLLMLGFWIPFSRPWTQNLRAVWKWLPIGIIAGFIPVELALLQGQDSILLLLIFSQALLLLDREKHFSAGAVLALGLFKLQLVIPMVLLFLLWRRWRFCAGFTLVGSVLVGVSVWLAGLAQSLVYLRSLASFGAGASRSSGLRFPIPITFMANLHGLFAGTVGSHISAASNTGLIAVASVLLLLWLCNQHSNDWTARDEFALAIIASVLVSYYLFFHDVVVLLIPLALMLDRSILSEVGGTKADRSLLRISALVFVSPVLILFAPGRFYLVSFCILALVVTAARYVQANRSKLSVSIE